MARASWTVVARGFSCRMNGHAGRDGGQSWLTVVGIGRRNDEQIQAVLSEHLAEVSVRGGLHAQGQFLCGLPSDVRDGDDLDVRVLQEIVGVCAPQNPCPDDSGFEHLNLSSWLLAALIVEPAMNASRAPGCGSHLAAPWRIIWSFVGT